MKFKYMNFYTLFFFLLMFLSTIMFIMFLIFLKYKYMIFIEWELTQMSMFVLEMVFLFDWMSFLFLSVVFFITALVFLYSLEYMSEKKNQFVLLIFLFVMSMALFILSPNLISILLGWDGLGLISYVLIIFFQSVKSKNSGMLTILLNRMGDIFIIFSSWYFFTIGGLNFLFYGSYFMNTGMTMIIIASMTKSAQIPFSSWLPAAMAAPTPVSSLVHSSTLVTAGIYLMLRFNMYMIYCETMTKMIFIIGTITMFISGIAANFENDLKKIIALSTLSQLGLMMLTLSFGLTVFSFFHLSIHALFKALLFLCAGVMIHNMKDNQDIRFMGQMSQFMPITTMCFNMANLSLCGFPFLSGFYSKDLIIEYFLMTEKNFVFILLICLSTSLTVSYTFRLLYFLLFFKKNYFFLINKHESKIFNFVLLSLTTISILSGTSMNWLLYSLFMNYSMGNLMKLIIPMILLFGLFMSYTFINCNKKLDFFSSLWYLNYTISSFKKIPMIYIEKIFFSSNFGFFEYFGGSGLKKMYKYLYVTNSFSYNFKLSSLLAIYLLLWALYL